MSASLGTTGLAPDGRSWHSPLSGSLTRPPAWFPFTFLPRNPEGTASESRERTCSVRGVGGEETAPSSVTPTLPAPPSPELPPAPGDPWSMCRLEPPRLGGGGAQMGPELAGSGSPLASRPLVGPGRCIIHDGRVDFLGAAPCLCLWR